MKGYNGYDNWNTWNVALWINNDEYQYRQAFELVQKIGRSLAAHKLFNEQYKGTKTPDGAKYTLKGIKAALADM